MRPIYLKHNPFVARASVGCEVSRASSCLFNRCHIDGYQPKVTGHDQMPIFNAILGLSQPYRWSEVMQVIISPGLCKEALLISFGPILDSTCKCRVNISLERILFTSNRCHLWDLGKFKVSSEIGTIEQFWVVLHKLP